MQEQKTFWKIYEQIWFPTYLRESCSIHQVLLPRRIYQQGWTVSLVFVFWEASLELWMDRFSELSLQKEDLTVALGQWFSPLQVPSNRNKVHNKCMRLNHPRTTLSPRSVENCLPRNWFLITAVETAVTLSGQKGLIVVFLHSSLLFCEALSPLRHMEFYHGSDQKVTPGHFPFSHST